jgi:ABC-type amino acid transport system permease subunit
VPINGFAAAVLGLSLNAGAFCAEILRGGILAVPRGQTEAALASGMNYMQTMRYVVLPQIVRSSLPPLIGQLISLVKDTSLASLISFQELMLMTQSIIDRTHRIFELYIGAAAVYFVICYPLSQLVRTVEKRLR